MRVFHCTMFNTNEILEQFSFSCSVLCKYEKTAYLEVRAPGTLLTPGQSMDVEILFYPREVKRYHDVIPFEINGLSQVTVDVFGQGTEIQVRPVYLY